MPKFLNGLNLYLDKYINFGQIPVNYEIILRILKNPDIKKNQRGNLFQKTVFEILVKVIRADTRLYLVISKCESVQVKSQ